MSDNTKTVYLHDCPRCGRDHADVSVTALNIPSVDGFTHYGTCPATEQPFFTLPPKNEEPKHPLVKLLEEAGYEESGGSDDFTSYTHPYQEAGIYLFQDKKGSLTGDDEDCTHWVQISNLTDDDFLTGGFSPKSLKCFLAIQKVLEENK